MRFGQTVLTLDEANRIMARSTPIDTNDVEAWVDPNKHNLVQRMSAAKQADRELLQGMLLESMGRGETGPQAAGRVEDFLTPLSSRLRNANRQVVNNHLSTPESLPLSPRSGKGSSRLRTLARTELTRAHGRATIEAARLNPFVEGVRWNLSGSHPRTDICDSNASGSSGPKFPAGVYRPGDIPSYPQHPNCLCFLSQEVFAKTAKIVRDLLRRERLPLKDAPFAISDDIDEAEVFAREVLGVEADYADDVQIGNLANRAMWDAKNQGGELPSRTTVRPFDELPNDNLGTFAQYNPNADTLEINSLRKDFFENDDMARSLNESGWFTTKDRIGLLHHELGHVDHFKTNPRGYTAAHYSVPDGRIEDIMGQVSKYATDNAEEFVAEVHAGRLAGREFSDEVNDLYDTLRTINIRSTSLDDATNELLDVLDNNFLPKHPIAAARARPFQDLSDEAIQDTIDLILKTPFNQRTATETGRLADLLHEKDVREARRLIGRLNPAEKIDLQQLDDVGESRLFDNAKDFWDEIADTDPNMHRAIKDYVHGDFSRTNSSKRRFGGVPERDPLLTPVDSLRNVDDSLERLFKEVQLEDDILLHRQMSRPRGKNILYEDPRVGDEFIDHGFLSTTVDENALPSIITGTPDRILEIRVPKDVPGQYVRPVGLSHEKEMILGPGLRYRIVGRGDETAEGLFKVVLEVVPEPEEIRLARRYSQWPDEINPPDMESALKNAPISKAQIKEGARTFRTEEQIDRFYDKSIRLAVTQSQKDVLEAKKLEVIGKWRAAQPPSLTVTERMNLIERLPQNPTRFQLRRVPYDERPEIRRLIELRHQTDELRPDQKRLRIRAIDEQFNRDRTYPRLLTPQEMVDLGESKVSKDAIKIAERKTITYVDSLGNTIQRQEPVSEWYKRLARSQVGGPDSVRQALRATPDQFARDAQIQQIRDAINRIWGFKPDTRRGAQVFIPTPKDTIIPRKGDILLSKPGQKVRIVPDPSSAIIVPRGKNIIPILIKRKGSSKVERVIIPRYDVSIAPTPVAHARPQGLVIRDILNEKSAPELNTRFRNLEPEDLIRNFEQRLGLSVRELTDEFPTFPHATSYDQAREIAIDVLQLSLDTGIDRTKPNLYGSIMNQMANAIVEQLMRGEPAPRKFVIMGTDEASMTFGTAPNHRSVAAYFPHGDTLLFNPDQSGFWSSDRQKNEFFSSGWSSAPERISTVVHEIGHWAHFHQDQTNYAILAQEFDRNEWKAAVEMLDIESRVSRYAAENEREFVAEMYSGIRSGREDLLADDLMEVYEWLGGPSIRGIFDRKN
jgi:hypothetical protein